MGSRSQRGSLDLGATCGQAHSRQAFVPYAFIKVVAKADFSMLGTQPRASPLKPCPAGVLIQLGKQMRSM